MDFYGGGYDLYDFFNDPSFITGMGFFFGVLMIFLLAVSAISLVLYIFRSIGLHRLAVNRGMSGAGLAWIPIVGSYRIGSIADDISAREGSRTYFRHVLLAGNIISAVFSSTSSNALASSLFSSMWPQEYYGSAFSRVFMTFGLVSSLISLISLTTFILMVVALNKIYKNYRPASSTSWTVLSVIFPFMQSIFPFVIRNDVPAPLQGAPWGMPPQGGYYPPTDGQWQVQPPNMGYPPPPPYQEQRPVEPGGYYPPRAPEPPQFYPPPQNYGSDQFPPYPPMGNDDPPANS